MIWTYFWRVSQPQITFISEHIDLRFTKSARKSHLKSPQSIYVTSFIFVAFHSHFKNKSPSEHHNTTHKQHKFGPFDQHATLSGLSCMLVILIWVSIFLSPICLCMSLKSTSVGLLFIIVYLPCMFLPTDHFLIWIHLSCLKTAQVLWRHGQRGLDQPSQQTKITYSGSSKHFQFEPKIM